MVCAVGEVTRARTAAPGLTVVTPGIRMAGTGRDDQKRADTLGAALSAGADMVVVGRAITGAPDVVAAARSMSAEAADFIGT